MPRQPRLNLPGLFNHVMARGIERRPIFRGTKDYQDFLKRLQTGLAKSACRCFAWALMPNHIHLLILSGTRGIVSLLHPLLTGYATAFNLRYRRSGHLFQNRYKSIICEEDPYFLELIRYIGLNPVRAGLVKTPTELAHYSWTSHKALMGNAVHPWLESEDVLGRFGQTLNEARSRYEQFLLDAWDQGHREDLEGGGLMRSTGGRESPGSGLTTGSEISFDARILGGSDFVQEILQQADIDEKISNSIRRSQSLEQLQHIIAAKMGVDHDALRHRDRRRIVADARAMLVYAAIDWLGKSGVEMAQWASLSSSAIAQAREKGRRLAKEHRLRDEFKTEILRSVP